MGGWVGGWGWGGSRALAFNFLEKNTFCGSAKLN